MESRQLELIEKAEKEIKQLNSTIEELEKTGIHLNGEFRDYSSENPVPKKHFELIVKKIEFMKSLGRS